MSNVGTFVHVKEKGNVFISIVIVIGSSIVITNYDGMHFN